ncbi:phage tail protein [Pseudomonas sp. B1(2018)]|uniref:phage tail protein n=1 Tax=Pseudomonas sp. B1(2018) TaxID=2233856 RepID=UPI000D5E984B|nr:phage tail protein [Pseudomonas sp. B1(2018)]PVZ56576.1 phage tail protein [Pseudomonas sp. B1(2018)]
MSQHDMNVANGPGLTFRTDMNQALVALASQSSGPSAPSPSFPCQVWGDTGTGRLKQRNSANTLWIDRGQLDAAQSTVVVGETRNGRMSVAAASATATYSADEVVVKTDLGGQALQISGFSQTINLATTGTNGMDTGLAPVSGYVAIYVISTIGGVARLLGVNATSAVAPEIYAGANMPSGYVASALVSVVPTNASRQFKVFSQIDRSISLPGAQVFSGGTGGLSLQSFSLAAAVPFNAISISGNLTNSSSSASNVGMTISSNSAGTSAQNVSGTVVAGGAINGSFAIDVAVAQTAYVSTTNTAGTPAFTISVTRYSI